MQTTRTKISVSLPRALVARIDRAARAESRSRSRVLEAWLERAAREAVEHELQAAVVAYYEGLTADDRDEAAGMASALSAAARRLQFDDPRPAGVKRRRRGR